MRIEVRIIEERDAWTWTVRQQEGMEEGVTLDYEDECESILSNWSHDLGGIEDAEALARAILAYTKHYRENNK